MSVILKNQAPDGQTLQAIFEPEKGMNMISFKKGDLEVIDQSTASLFTERYAGLGALIGPHFHHRKKETLPTIQDESLFPHIERIKAKGIAEPFSHGIGRYAPWKYEKTETSIYAKLSGKDQWQGVNLADLEGQNFTMTYNAHLFSNGLEIELSVVSDTDSCVGIHFYYHLPQKKGKVIAQVQNQFLKEGKRESIPEDWTFNSQNELTFDLSHPADFTFHPFPNVLEGVVLLDAVDYRLKTHYRCNNEENSWHLYHPKESSFVCIEPVSAADPRHPNLTVSSLKIHLEVLPSDSKGII